MESKKYFKMYKSGKLWVTAALVGFSVMAGVSANDQQAKAADNAPATETAQPATNNGQNATANNNAAASSAVNGNGQATATQGDQTDQGKQEDKPTPAETVKDETVSRQVNFVNAGEDKVIKTQTQTAHVKATTKDGQKRMILKIIRMLPGPIRIRCQNTRE